MITNRTKFRKGTSCLTVFLFHFIVGILFAEVPKLSLGELLPKPLLLAENEEVTPEQYEQQWKQYEEQQTEAWRKFYRLPTPPVKKVEQFSPYSPAVTVSIPTGFGSRWGDVFGGAFVQLQTRRTETIDGAISGGFGVGDPAKYVGASMVVSVYDLIGNTGKDGSLGLKVHRLISESFGVALGVENLLGWGNFDAPFGIYAAATRFFFMNDDPHAMFSNATLSVGFGSGRFNPESKVLAENTGSPFNPFFGGSIRVIEQVNAILNWNGQNLDFGLSYAPFEKFSLVITPALMDLLGTAGDGVRLSISIGGALKFSNTPDQYHAVQQ